MLYTNSRVIAKARQSVHVSVQGCKGSEQDDVNSDHSPWQPSLDFSYENVPCRGGIHGQGVLMHQDD